MVSWGKEKEWIRIYVAGEADIVLPIKRWLCLKRKFPFFKWKFIYNQLINFSYHWKTVIKLSSNVRNMICTTCSTARQLVSHILFVGNGWLGRFYCLFKPELKTQKLFPQREKNWKHSFFNFFGRAKCCHQKKIYF